MMQDWHLLNEPVRFEIRALREGAAPQSAIFKPEWLDDAVSFIADLNSKRFNTYAVRNPLRDNVVGSGTDEDVVAAFFLWADFDDPGTAEKVLKWSGPKYSAAVVTGNIPGARVHTYWRLAEPCRDLTLWRDTQAAIAAHLGSDSTAINASRIMRIGGTITWPFENKRKRGYVSELTTIRTVYSDERAPVTIDQMRRAFGHTEAFVKPLAIDTALGDVRPPLDRERARIQALSGQEWHNAVIRLVASYVSKGLSDDEIHGLTAPLTLSGYTVEQTRAEVQTAIDGARRKGWTPDPQDAQATTLNISTPAPPFDTTPLSLSDLDGIQPRQWLYGHKFIRGFCSIIVSAGGVAKSTWASAVAVDMAEGRQTLHDAPHGVLRSWIYNLEDPREETLRKLAAIKLHKGLSAAAAGNLIVTSGRDRPLIVATEAERKLFVATPDVEALIEAMKAAQVDVLFVDPAVRAHRLPENDNKAIDLMMDQFARVAHEANAAVVLIHHTRKGFVGGEMDSMRGASSMASAARVVLTLSTMTAEEAASMNVPEAERRFHIRVDNAKSNLAPPAAQAEWVKLESQELANGTSEYPHGDAVGVITKWAPPDPFAGIGPFMTEIIERIDRGFVHEDGSVEPYSMNKRAIRYIANAVLASFPDGSKTESQAMALIRDWIKKGILEERDCIDRKREKARGVFVVNGGDNEA